MIKILANDGIEKSAQQELEKLGYTVSTEKVPQPDLIKAINELNYQVVLVRSATKITKEIIDSCPNLQLIGRAGVGIDNIDVEAAKLKGVHVFNTPASSSVSVAELVIGQLFTMARQLHESNRMMPEIGTTDSVATGFETLKKNYGKGFELRGKNIGIIGFGRIGQEVAKYGVGLGMKVWIYDTNKTEAKITLLYNDISVTLPVYDFETVIKNADFITLHVPKQKDGKAVITKAEIEKMKPGVCLINTSRGGLIDEQDLVAGLDAGKIKAAALDVFDNEPTPKESLLKHPKISLTPHIGAATIEAQERIGKEIIENVVSYYNEKLRIKN